MAIATRCNKLILHAPTGTKIKNYYFKFIWNFTNLNFSTVSLIFHALSSQFTSTPPS